MRVVRFPEEPFSRIVVEDDAHLNDPETLLPYIELAVQLADESKKPAHIQYQNEITWDLVYPEVVKC